MKGAVIFFLIGSIVLALEGPLDVKPLVEDMCNMRLLKTTSYTSVLKDGNSSTYEKAIAWMNLLYFSKAIETFKESGKREAEFFITRLKALSGNRDSAENYLKTLPDTPCGKMERLFVRAVVYGEKDLSEMRRIYESDGGDFMAFEYLYVYRTVDLESAIKLANRRLRGIEEIIVDYDHLILKKTYYPLILLTAGMLYDYAVEKIEDIFKMSIDELLNMDSRKRDAMVFSVAMFERPKDFKMARAALERILELLSYNANDYGFLSDIKFPPSLGVTHGMSFLDFITRVKTLVSIMKLD